MSEPLEIVFKGVRYRIGSTGHISMATHDGWLPITWRNKQSLEEFWLQVREEHGEVDYVFEGSGCEAAGEEAADPARLVLVDAADERFRADWCG